MLGRTRLHPTSLPSDVCHKWKLLSPSFPGKRKDWFNEACKTPTPSSSVRPSFLLSEPPKLCFSHCSRPPAPNPSALESSGNAGGWKDCCRPRRCRLRAASGSALDSSRPSPTKGTQLIDRGADQTESKTNWSRPSRVWLRPSCLFKPAFLPRAGRGRSVVCGQS